MLKVLIYGINFAPELTGIGKYTGEMAAWLAKQGVLVRVVTAPPYYPEWKVGVGYSCWKYTREIWQNVFITRCPIYVPSRVTGVKRVLHLASFGATSLPALLASGCGRPDVIVAIEPTFFSVPQALMMARLCGAKAWLHVQDFELDACLQLGLLPNGLPLKIAMEIERRVIRGFDVVSSISGKMMERLLQKGVQGQKTYRLNNWVDTEQVYPLDGPSPLREEFGIPVGTRVALYSGNMGKKQGLESIITAARLLSNHPIRFVLCGTGATRDELVAKAEGLKNVQFMPLQPLERLNDLLNLADIHLLPQRPDVEDLVMPSKLTGILASGGLAVATAKPDTELAHTVDSAGGFVVAPGDDAAFAQGILRALEDSDQFVAKRHQARNFAMRNMAREAILSQFLDKLKTVCKTPRTPSRRATGGTDESHP